MQIQHSIDTYHPQLLLRYFRKLNQLSQVEMANILMCSRPRYSRLENGLLPISLTEWSAFSDWSGIYFLGLEINQIDSIAPIVFLPRSLREHGYISGKQGRVLISFAREFLGTELINRFIKDLGVDPIYFVNSSNPFPFTIFLRLIQLLKIHGMLFQTKEIHFLINKIISSNQWWGSKTQAINTLIANNDLSELVDHWAKKSKNHKVQFESKESMTKTSYLSIEPLEHIDKNLYFLDPILQDFMGEWFEAFINCLSSFTYKITKEKKEMEWRYTLRCQKILH